MHLTQSEYITVVVTNPNAAPALDPVPAHPEDVSTLFDSFLIANGDTLTVKIDDTLEVRTITFVGHRDPEAMTPAQVVAQINSQLVYGEAYVKTAGGKDYVAIRSSNVGALASVQITGGTANTVLAFAGAKISGTALAVFKTNFIDTREVVFAVVKSDMDVEAAVDVTIAAYGYAPDGYWHLFQEVVISETGICDFFVLVPVQYEYIYLRKTAGATTVKASLINSVA